MTCFVFGKVFMKSAITARVEGLKMLGVRMRMEPPELFKSLSLVLISASTTSHVAFFPVTVGCCVRVESYNHKIEPCARAFVPPKRKRYGESSLICFEVSGSTLIGRPSRT